MTVMIRRFRGLNQEPWSRDSVMNEVGGGAGRLRIDCACDVLPTHPMILHTVIYVR
jgi:hypothetical protein